MSKFWTRASSCGMTADEDEEVCNIGYLRKDAGNVQDVIRLSYPSFIPSNVFRQRKSSWKVSSVAERTCYIADVQILDEGIILRNDS
ncbi:hypothetical protein Mp_7g01330 [Marchantia polymorpha subsp. ruderalis]|uniref:Uncharacterized protein n=2 Tax=Marchantia polymorpha TaxID=3197 RepID=A0AAF6BV05_MARPO|nr:hypothetical protein MARPO_0099s0007 [Marchantia polymorpha]BBN15839.1 hypothetical protein Mp_7g01330 [Marchantia polymorpha subsp. ruderalis]|eukprot:PTQ32367.1 hypothetical protein MARPO_0099s0007 [Marchantia polymorpha]